MNRLGKHLRNTFLAGIFAAIPLAATAFVVIYVEQHTRALFPLDIPFAGVVAAVAAIYLLGLLVTSVIGKYLIRLLDRLLTRLPLLRELYQAWKQVSVTPAGRSGMFSRVVLITHDAPHVRTIAFTSAQPLGADHSMLCVFIPNAPNPASGRVCFVRSADCEFLDMPAEEAFKLLLSGGNYIPDALARACPTDVTASPLPRPPETSAPQTRQPAAP
jgi:uncharacterized membrane protein